MASNYPSPPASPKALDELLICPVCLESYNEPKTLSCLHSFCANCLENCRRPYRRDITCPVCKKVTLLPTTGILGLQNDFRIQQIRDILLNLSPTTSRADCAAANVGDRQVVEETKLCGFCESQQKSVPAYFHCIQCSMCFCTECNDKHNSNHIFTSHHVVHLRESHALEVLFCRSHKEHQVKYFCTTCKQMLCTICIMGHDTSHKPEPLEKGIIEKYKKELQDSLNAINCKLYEVKCKTKFLETIRETHQRTLYEAQVAIRSRTEAIICKVRQRERELLDEAQKKIDARLKGVEKLTDMKFYKSSIEQLCKEIENVIVGSPQKCLLEFDDIKAKVQSVPEANLKIDIPKDSESVIRFIPVNPDTDIVIGMLQECSVSDSVRNKTRHSDLGLSTTDDPAGMQDDSGHSATVRHAPYSPKSKKRSTSIMNAISPTKRTDVVKMGRMKGEKSNHSHVRGKINADEVLCSGSSTTSKSNPTTGYALRSLESNSEVDILSSVLDAPTTSKDAKASFAKSSASSILPCSSKLPGPTTAKSDVLLVQRFVVDQSGGWPGKVFNPTSVTFSPDGNIVISESDTRLQVFDQRGKSVKIIGWGQCQPQSVVFRDNGEMIVADRKDRCLKVFKVEGEIKNTWGEKVFKNGLPAGLAISKCGNIIVTDAQRHMVSIFSCTGELLSEFGAWGSGNYQFNNPLYVTTDEDDNILIADLGNACIKIFDKLGHFLYKFVVHAGNPTIPIKPQGIAVLGKAYILVCDRENHNILQFDRKGCFIKSVLGKTDGVSFPCDIETSLSHNLLAVVENHSGLLLHEPHHAVRVFHLKLK